MAFRNKKNNEFNNKKLFSNKQYNLEEERYKSDTQERERIAGWVKVIIPCWLGITAAILVFKGLKVFYLSDTVLGILLGTTTANVLGLGYIVLKGLYPNNDK